MIQSDPKWTEVREMIYRLAAVQCPIYAMNQMKKSLEDVFIELTADGTERFAAGTKQSFGKVNTAFTPAEQALIERTERQELERQNLQNKLLQQATLPPAAAGAAQTCRELQQDKVSYLKRRIEEQYHTAYNNCDISYASTTAAKRWMPVTGMQSRRCKKKCRPCPRYMSVVINR